MMKRSSAFGELGRKLPAMKLLRFWEIFIQCTCSLWRVFCNRWLSMCVRMVAVFPVSSNVIRANNMLRKQLSINFSSTLCSSYLNWTSINSASGSLFSWLSQWWFSCWLMGSVMVVHRNIIMWLSHPALLPCHYSSGVNEHKYSP